MKTCTLAVILLLITQIALTQQSYTFNNTYKPDTAITALVSVECVDNAYWVAGSVVPIGADHGKIYLQKLSYTGESKSIFLIDTGFAYRTMGLGGSMRKNYNNDLIVVFTKGETEYTRDFVLVKVNSSNEIVFKTQYVRSSNQNFAQVVPCADGGYCIIGTSQHFYSPTNFESARIHVIKTDSNGEVEWEYIYPSNNVAPLYAEQTQDGGFIISGYQYNSLTGYDMYVLKINAQGGIEWEKTYGTPVDDGGCTVQSYPLGGYYLLGLKWGGGVIHQLYGAWLDDVGNVMNANALTKNEVYSIGGAPIFSNDGSYKMVTISYGPPPIWEVAFTTFDNSGNIVTEIPISTGLPGEDYIRDLEPTPDGGFIMAGFRYIGYPESSWVVKLGPNGEYCGVAPCVDSLFVSNISHPVAGGQGKPVIQAQMYPNPAQGSTTISLFPTPSVTFWGSRVVRFTRTEGAVLDFTGRRFTPTCNTLDLSGLPSGVYVWRLSLPGGYERYEESGKIIVND